jgi:predicted ATP-grasp superfamily ATP-dependent carboligase
MSKDVIIEEITSLNKVKHTVLCGFSGPGFLGNTALMYITRSKNFELKARVRSRLLPPSVILFEGRPINPFRIYSDDNGMLLVVSEARISPENSWTLGLKLMEWLLVQGVKEFLTIEPMVINTALREIPVYGFSVPSRDLTEYGVKPLTEGGVSGLNAVLFEEAFERHIPWTTFVVPTRLASYVDYVGAAAIIEVLNRMFKLGVDVSLLTRSDEIRQQLTEQMRPQEERRGFLDSLRRRR